MKSDRTKKFGIICRVVIDRGEVSKKNNHRTRVFRKDVTKNRPDYRDLMSNGGEGWRGEHSERGLLEWGTPIDYMGMGTKLLLYDTYAKEITVVADVDPDLCYEDKKNYYSVRNIIIDGSIRVLERPITLIEITSVSGLEDFQKNRRFMDITEEQYLNLIDGRLNEN